MSPTVILVLLIQSVYNIVDIFPFYAFSIELLHELKNKFIADAVTGKIDVRGIQIPEYEFADEEPDTEDSKEAEGQEEFFDE